MKYPAICLNPVGQNNPTCYLPSPQTLSDGFFKDISTEHNSDYLKPDSDRVQRALYNGAIKVRNKNKLTTTGCQEVKYSSNKLVLSQLLAS